MYEDIIELAQNQMFLEAIGGSKPNTGLLKRLSPYEQLKDFEKSLEQEGSVDFSKVFQEPVGYYLIKSFLITELSVDKAVFVSDVKLYKSLTDPSARKQVGLKIYERFCAPEKQEHIPGLSVFGNKEDDATLDRTNSLQLQDRFSFLAQDTNVIGVYGKSLRTLKGEINKPSPAQDIFKQVTEEVLNDLRLDVFPRFCKSLFYKMYIRCKALEDKPIGVRDFQVLRVLGRGAFGSVNACIKKDTGKVYAMKRINKKRVQATDSVDTIMSERNFLADMESNFVTTLKYALMDSDTLYLVLDLMVGGDLKFHLNKDETFREDRSRFYAAEVLLGLEHMHSKKIIYRDLKLENVLLDDRGHCKISDLGLAVRKKEGRKVKGYAGTPGYTAPEVVLNHPYDHRADFFSLGVMIFRFLCGKKPFARKRTDRHHRRDKKHDKQKRKSSELDKNVVEIEPEYNPQHFSPECKSLLKGLMAKSPNNRLGSNGISEIKQHPWFDHVDFGLLEAGYLDPPFVPRLDEVNAASPMDIGRPPRDHQYERVTLTTEFEESLKGFPYVCHKSLQEEIVEVLKRADAEKLTHLDNNICAMPYEGEPRGNGSCLGNCELM